jgi:hypothetical protein
MDPQDAIELDNFFPGFGKCEMRRGSASYAELSTPGAVETLAELKTSAGPKLLAAAGGGLWDATAGGSIGTALGATTTFSNDRWQYVAMNDVLGLVNGADAPQTFDGTAKAAMTISSGDVTVATLAGINTFKSRSWFWTGADQDAYYSAVNTLGGALTQFPLADVGTFGGVLVAVDTWTRDGGDGMDDLIVFRMSGGEAIVYQGSDPGDAADWSKIGVFRIGAPLGIRASAKIGADTLMATTDGYSLLSKSLPGGRSSRAAQISDKIVKAAIEQAEATGGELGWDILFYPRRQQVLINHPTGSTYYQHVVNLATGAWCRFKGMPARCWVLFDDAPYFGGANGVVYLADTGLTDDGVQVVASGRQAFSYLGTKARNKQVTMMGPLLEAGGPVSLTLGLAADFAPAPTATVRVTLTPPASGSDWNTADWNTATWGSSATVIQDWLAHTARGYAISPSVRVDSRSSAVSWNATRFAYQRAGVI